MVKRYKKQKEVAAAPAQDAAADAAAGKADFPKDGLPYALRVAQAIEEKNAGRPYPPDELKKALKIKTAPTLRGMLAASSKYDLTVGTATSDRITLTATGRETVAPSSPDAKRDALVRVFLHPESFGGFYRHYAGKTLPEEQYISNTLVREFGIQKSKQRGSLRCSSKVRATSACSMMRRPGRCHSSLLAKRRCRRPPRKERWTKWNRGSPNPQKAAQHGDTCFVLMPFGDFFDKYYKNATSRPSPRQGLSITSWVWLMQLASRLFSLRLASTTSLSIFDTSE
jgi:hypothetical protein